MHEVLVNRLGGLNLPLKSVVRLTDRPDMTLDVYSGCKTTTKQQQLQILYFLMRDVLGCGVIPYFSLSIIIPYPFLMSFTFQSFLETWCKSKLQQDPVKGQDNT